MSKSKTDRPLEQAIGTYTGRKFWPLDARPEEVDIIDIAHALSCMCRFNGHVTEFYSVAQHSVMVSHLVPEQDAMWGLLHDASEAYIADIVRPINSSLTNYAEIEENLMKVIAEAFNLPWPMPPSVKVADSVALKTEQRDLKPHSSKWCPHTDGVKPLPTRIRAFDQRTAERLFLNRFHQLELSK